MHTEVVLRSRVVVRVLQLSQDYLPQIGGIAAHVYNLSLALQRCGHQVTVATTRYPLRNLTDWRIRRCRLAELDTLDFPVMYSPRNLLRDLQLSLRYAGYLRRLIREEGFQFVHWHTWGEDLPVVVGLGGIVPAVFTNHSSLFLSDLAAGRRREAYEKMAPADMVLAPSAELVEKTIEAGIQAERVFEIDNGVDVESFSSLPPKLRRDLRTRLLGGSHVGRPVLLCARRWARKNGVHVLLDSLASLAGEHAFTKHRPIVVFAGNPSANEPVDDDGRQMLERVADLSKRGLDLRLVGKVPILEIAEYYQAADFSLLPSLVEAKSLAALESMASGAVVISTDSGGLDQLVDDGRTGIKVAAGDARAFAAGIMRGLDSCDRLAIRSEARRMVEQKYSWRAVAQRHIQLYSRLL